MKPSFNFLFPKGFVPPHELSGKDPSTPLLVAYSGGADSTALLHMLCQYAKETGAPVFAAHLNHGIRGEEALRDEELCRQVTEQYGVPLFVRRENIPALAKETGNSIETAARDARYRFFEECMKENGIPLLCTAHHADDNLETIIFHLARGSGLSGLCGIPSRRELSCGTLIRPLLKLSRHTLQEYCRAYEISYATDSTNVNTAYTRNRIRAEVIPVLKELCPAAESAAARLSEVLSADARCLDGMAISFFEEYRQENALPVDRLNAIPSAVSSRVLMMLFDTLSDKALEYVHVTSLLALAEKNVAGSSVDLPNGMQAIIEGNLLCFRRWIEKPTPVEDYCIPLSEGLQVLTPIGGEIFLGEPKDSINIYKKEILLQLDSAKIEGRIYARNRRAGDKLLLLGVRRNVRKLMNEKKIPLALRPRLPVFCDDRGVLAVPLLGVRDDCYPKKDIDPDSILSIHFYLYE